MGWLITLGVLIVLAVLPLGVCFCYDDNGILVKIITGPLQWQVLPSTNKEKKQDSQKKTNKKQENLSNKANATQKQAATQDSAAKQGGNILDFLPLLHIAMDFLGDFTRKLRVNRLDVNLVLAGDDPCDLATNYAKAWTAVGNLWPRLEEIFVIRKRNVQVQCDFETNVTRVLVRLNISITLGRLIYLIVCYGIRALVQYMKITNKGKGGAAT